ncbi:unnamed protein product [Caenorhabditis bovis]|uniref:SH3 domain-containing protein n=1 Tax=Caenorhabditis bovis TaxID=2654633 RepID=A0A8S1ED40_9PELO|nr:unnamed protein product [Caenorhabditis bovis]
MHDDGGMSMPDLEALIDSRIPEHRNQLETSHANLENVAAYCEENYLNHRDKAQALYETKNYAVQSLASVAYQINTMSRDLLDMLELQTDKVSALSTRISLVNQVVDIHKEKLARREIGALTTNKSLIKQPKIIAPAIVEPKQRYMRTPIDYSVLDGIGHGVRAVEPPKTQIRAPSSISGAYHNSPSDYGTYSERTATLGRAHIRPGYASSAIPASDYRVPHVGGSSGSGGSNVSRQISHGGSSEYGSNSDYHHLYSSEKYGTIRASRPTTRGGVDDSPTLPLPPPNLTSQHYGGYVPPGQILQHDKYGTIRGTMVNPPTALDAKNELPPPPSSLLSQSTHEDADDLPPPPESVSGSSAYGVFGITANTSSSSANLFDVHSDWVPVGEFIEKAVVLYDYEAEKADELTLRENAIVYVVRKNDDGWYEGVLDGVTGLFPGNYVQAI